MHLNGSKLNSDCDLIHLFTFGDTKYIAITIKHQNLKYIIQILD